MAHAALEPALHCAARVQSLPTLIIPLFKYSIFLSSANDTLLRSTLKASVSLARLLLLFTLEGSCFAYDKMIVHTSGRQRVPLNVANCDQAHTRPAQDCRSPHLHSPPVCGQSTATTVRLHASCLQHPN